MRNGSDQRRWWRFILLSSVAIICFSGAVYQAQRFAGLSGSVLARYKEPSLIINEVEDALENARAHTGTVLDATLWLRYEDQSVLNEWNREVTLPVLLVNGDGKLAYPSYYMMGDSPVRGDAKGCAVDQKAADALFGSQNVLGNVLAWEGHLYIIRGIIKGMDGIVIIQADEGDERKFNTLALRVPPEANGREVVESFVFSNGLAMPDAILDAPFRIQFMEAVALLPAWIIAITLIVKMITRTVRLRATPILCLCAAIATVAIAAIILYAAQFSPPWPERFIPTKWSDFTFWKELISQWQVHARQIRSIDALISDRMRNNIAVNCVFLSASAVACFTGAMAIKLSFSLRRWLIASFWTVVLTFLLLLLFSALLKPVDAPMALWLTWVLYMLLISIYQDSFHYTGDN